MPRRLLLVDDDEDDALFFSDALRDLHLPIAMDYFNNGHAALNSLSQVKTIMPDIIFLDVNMPSITGWECLREIKNIASVHTVPIVIYSTADLQKEGVDASSIGAAALYKKANSFEELKRDLKDLLNSILKLNGV